MSTKKLQILGVLGNQIYVQNEEPVDAPDKTLWLDLSSSSAQSVDDEEPSNEVGR